MVYTTCSLCSALIDWVNWLERALEVSIQSTRRRSNLSDAEEVLMQYQVLFHPSSIAFVGVGILMLLLSELLLVASLRVWIFYCVFAPSSCRTFMSRLLQWSVSFRRLLRNTCKFRTWCRISLYACMWRVSTCRHICMMSNNSFFSNMLLSEVWNSRNLNFLCAILGSSHMIGQISYILYVSSVSFLGFLWWMHVNIKVAFENLSLSLKACVAYPILISIFFPHFLLFLLKLLLLFLI